MLLPRILEGERVILLCLIEPLLASANSSGRSERRISPLVGVSSQVLRRSFADTVLMGSRYFTLLSYDTAAPLTAISAPQPFDSGLDRERFPKRLQKGGQPADHRVAL